MNNQENTLATEIIKTLKKIIFALIITNILTIGAFMWYISLPAEESTSTITQEADNDSENNFVGGDYIGSETDSNN